MSFSKYDSSCRCNTLSDRSSCLIAIPPVARRLYFTERRTCKLIYIPEVIKRLGNISMICHIKMSLKYVCLGIAFTMFLSNSLSVACNLNSSIFTVVASDYKPIFTLSSCLCAYALHYLKLTMNLQCYVHKAICDLRYSE